jgi:hypothetical protein
MPEENRDNLVKPGMNAGGHGAVITDELSGFAFGPALCCQVCEGGLAVQEVNDHLLGPCQGFDEITLSR